MIPREHIGHVLIALFFFLLISMSWFHGYGVGYDEGYECGAVDAYVFLMTPNIEMAERAGYQSSAADLLPERPDYCRP